MIISSAVKNTFRILWIGTLLLCLLLYIGYREHLTASDIVRWITGHTRSLAVVYCLLCILRGFTLLPSTPFIFAGILLFPHRPGFLLLISLICILLSSALIYYASRYLGFGDYFEKNFPSKISSIRSKLNKSTGFYFIAGWSFVPFVPTDLIVYVAGNLKLPFHKLIFPLMSGEAIICAVYIFGGAQLIGYLS